MIGVLEFLYSEEELNGIKVLKLLLLVNNNTKLALIS